jgi:uncharacterized sulfatase
MTHITRRTLLAAAAAPLVTPQQQKRPNVLFILADDLGWGDLGCYGNTRIHTVDADQK